jgi:hypothetical protein
MIEWYRVFARDQAANNWILYDDSFLTLRERYHQFRCPSCCKVDSDAALKTGLDDIRIRSRCDIFHSSDGVYCFSERAIDVWQAHNIQGMEFLPFPKPNRLNHHVALPTVIVPVDRATAGFQYVNVPYGDLPDLKDPEIFCPVCFRPWQDACVGPFLQSMQPPEDPFVVFAPSIFSESVYCKVFSIFVSSIVKEILEKARIIGPEFHLA